MEGGKLFPRNIIVCDRGFPFGTTDGMTRSMSMPFNPVEVERTQTTAAGNTFQQIEELPLYLVRNLLKGRLS